MSISCVSAAVYFMVAIVLSLTTVCVHCSWDYWSRLVEECYCLVVSICSSDLQGYRLPVRRLLCRVLYEDAN